MKKHILKEERIDKILYSLKNLDYLTTSQIRVLHNLKSQRNTSRVLIDMKDYVSHFRDDENIYYLSSEGRLRCGAKVIRKKTIQAGHYIMRNQLYIAYGCPKDWVNEVVMGVKGQFSINCDATFTMNGAKCIVEVDHTQKMSVNKAKMEKYQKLMKLGFFKVQPAFIWVTTTERKKDKLKQLCNEFGLPCKVFTMLDINIDI